MSDKLGSREGRFFTCLLYRLVQVLQTVKTLKLQIYALHLSRRRHV